MGQPVGADANNNDTHRHMTTRAHIIAVASGDAQHGDERLYSPAAIGCVPGTKKKRQETGGRIGAWS